MKKVIRLAVFVLLGLIVSVALPAQERFALVIGNGAYASMPKLRNPANDANDMAAALKKLGFKVALKIDATRRDMNQAIVAFRETLSSAPQSEGVFFYSGHGVQSARGQNYLLPVDAAVKADSDLEDEAVRAQKILDSLDEARNRVNLVILDACRDSPLPASARGSARGLSVVSSAPPETVVLYSTAAGQTAADGSGRNSPFTAALLKYLPESGDITRVIKLVIGEVKAKTPEKQTPFVYSNLSKDFLLNPKAAAARPKLSSGGSTEADFGDISVAPGSVILSFVTAGRLSFKGRTLDVPAGGSLPVNNLAPGDYPAVMSYADGKTEKQDVHIEAGKAARVGFSYQPGPAAGTHFMLKVNSNVQGAQVFIDGKLVGNAGAGYRMASGIHTVKVSAAGYNDYIYSIRLDRDVTVAAFLAPARAAPSNQGKQP